MLATRASAQNAAPTTSAVGARKQPPVSSRGRLAVTGCSGQPISDILVMPREPFADRVPAQLAPLNRVVDLVHTTTQADVIRRFLLVKVGEPCNQIKRAESERILRAQPYLVDARIFAYDDEKGGVRLEVETRDDMSLILSPVVKASTPMFRALEVGDGNVGGRAVMAAVEWRDGLAYRNRYGFDYTDYLFGMARNEFRLSAHRREVGHELDAQIVRPYYTDFQRYAWIANIGSMQEPSWLDRRRDAPAALLTTREYAQMGGVTRLGTIGRLKLIGASLSREARRTDSTLMRYSSFGAMPDTVLTLPGAYPGQQVVRANLLVGLRAIRFVRVQGFDALTGAQDVRVGMQLGLVGGQSLGVGGSIDRDRFVASNLYLGVGRETWFLGMQGVAEGRYDRKRSSWANVVSSGRLAYYFRPAVRQTSVLQAEWSGGRHMEIPAQLSLSDRQGGLLAHRNSIAAGASRLVFRGEQRFVVPTRLNVGDAGLAAFFEAGKLWSDPTVPFSVETPWRGAVGVSFLAAVPPRSRRLWRVDFAMPVGADPDRRFQVRLSSTDRSRVFWVEPNDVSRSRERTAPTSLFSWP